MTRHARHALLADRNTSTACESRCARRAGPLDAHRARGAGPLARLLAAGVVGAAGVAACVCGLAGCTLRPAPDQLPDTSAAMREATELAQQAQQLEKSGRPDEAIELYRRSAATYRDFPASWNNLGALLMDKGQNMEAIEAFRVAAELAPTDPRPHTNIGLLWQRLGYLNDAADAFTLALNRDPAYLPALRESVVIDVQRDTITDETANRIRKALLQETDKAWKTDLERRRGLIEQRLASQRDSLAR